MADSQRKTANLFSIDMVHDDYSTLVYHYTISGLTPNNRYTCSSNFVQSGSYASIWFGGTSTGTNGVSDGNPKTMTSNANGEIDFYINHNTGNAYSQVVNGTAWVMVNEGSTPLPYEPYWQHSLRKLGTSTDTITTLPADLYADGNNATVGLVGNMSQTGTPTPSSPITPSECGERTGNLFDGEYPDIDGTVRYRALNLGNGTYTLSSTVEISQGSAGTLFFLAGNVSSGASTATNAVYKDRPITVTAIDGYVTIAYRTYTTDTPVGKETMLNEGSTPLSYEPYGYKIPILSASTTTHVYLGEVESTRKIKKLVLTGGEDWVLRAELQGATSYQLQISDIGVTYTIAECICSHYKFLASYGDVSDHIYQYVSTNFFIAITDTTNLTLPDFKTYLQQQYAAGTPVTVWYVLANDTTGIVNEPLRKIGNYVDTVSGITIPTITGKDTFDVLTTLKPSEVSLTYTGWHDASVKEKSRNLFDGATAYGAMYSDGVITGQGNAINNIKNKVTPDMIGNTYTLSITPLRIASRAYMAITINGTTYWRDNELTVNQRSSFLFTPVTENDQWFITYDNSGVYSYENIMLNTGSTVLPYEPYWK